jgi:hypothetical protein
MMSRLCIICKEQKDESLFNEEHIIPAALGGNFTIDTVCINCNSNLGKSIDNPLLKNTGILHYRNTFDLTRQASGSIPNPFKGTHIDSEGNPHLVDYRDGKIATQALERFEIKNIPGLDKAMGTLTVPIEKMNEADEIIKKYLKRHGVKSEEYKLITIEKNEPNSAVEVKAILDHNSFIFGCVKIAYESILMLFPGAIEDEGLDTLRLFLKTGILTDHLKKILEEGSGLNKFYLNKLSTIDYLTFNHQIILIEQIENVGLVCMVRLFDLMYPVILSKTFKPINPGNEIVFFNDCLSSIHGTNINHSILDTSVQIDLRILSIVEEQQIRDSEGGKILKTNSKIPLFDRSKVLLFEDVQDFGKKLLADQGNRFPWTQSLINFELEPNKYFLKVLDERLVPILSVTLKIGVVLQKITKELETHK